MTKGPSSVLYGPNTLGGLVNVITRRPTVEPRLTLTGSYGDRDTKSLGADASYSLKKFSLAADALYQGSDGFDGGPARPSPDGEPLAKAMAARADDLRRPCPPASGGV